MAEHPHISFVIAARNDDYGHNLLNRLRNSARTLAYFAEKLGADFEYVITEYCPPADRAPLATELAGLSNGLFRIRTITVPKSFHERVAEGSKNPFLEYVAKNIGIRRARGTYIAGTNPDILFSEPLVRFLASDELDRQLVYRANRHDLSLRTIAESVPVPNALALCRSSVTRVWTSRDQRYISFGRWWRRLVNHPHPKSIVRNLALCPLLNPFRPGPDTGAFHAATAGDFVMAHRDVWAKVRGYDQTPVNSHQDGYNLAMFLVHGFTQHIIPHPMYHMNHDVINSAKFQIDHAEYERTVGRMLETGIPYKTYAENWGYPEEDFAETNV